MIPLFDAYPHLKIAVPHVKLCNLPTPVLPLTILGKQIGVENLYTKHDGVSSLPFGGNKIRKLEFLLGAAAVQGVKEVLTFGYAGSNHALATSIYAGRLGLRSISMLMPQANARYVRRNLLMGEYSGAEMHYYPDKKHLFRGAKIQKFVHFFKTRNVPYIIPPGGSSPAGIMGFVNAAFELKEQLEEENIPFPGKIYVGLGTGGTYIGLLIGFKMLGIDCKIIPVRVVGEDFLDKIMIVKLFTRTCDFLRAWEKNIPEISLDPAEIQIRDEFLGDGYARFTEAGMEAVRLMEDIEGIRLDGTYTGKVFAAIVADARRGELKGQNVLFWNTLNAYDLSKSVSEVDYRRLPKTLHTYFEEDVQPLDKDSPQ